MAERSVFLVVVLFFLVHLQLAFSVPLLQTSLTANWKTSRFIVQEARFGFI